MTAQDSSASIWIAEAGYRKTATTSALMAALILLGCVLPYPPIIAVAAFPRPKVPEWAAYAYWVILGVSIIGLIWAVARPRHMGMRLDERGVKVCNYLRTYRLGWGQVSYFTDGFAACVDLNHGSVRRGWALSVILRDGKGITATATMAILVNPEILTAVEVAAQRHQVSARLTGVAADRPRAWLDEESEARRQSVRYRVSLGATAAASASAAALAVWGMTHQGNFYLAVVVGFVALGGSLITRRARKARERLTR